MAEATVQLVSSVPPPDTGDHSADELVFDFELVAAGMISAEGRTDLDATGSVIRAVEMAFELALERLGGPSWSSMAHTMHRRTPD
jgi:hypothetical protein